MDEATPRSPRWARHLVVPVMLALTLTLGLAACGGDSPTEAVATLDGDAADPATDQDTSNADTEMTEEERQQAMLDFARCMREHGVDMPDPTFDDNGRGAILVNGSAAGGPDGSVFEAAQEACQPLMQAVIDSAPEMDPEEMEKRKQEALDFAKCMRDHGVDFPDPVFEDGGRMTQMMTADPNDPAFKAAMEECAPEGGDGPGFSAGAPIGGSDSGPTNVQSGADE